MNWAEAFATVGVFASFAAMIIAACYYGTKGYSAPASVQSPYQVPRRRIQFRDVTWYSKTEYHTPKEEESGQAV